MEIRGFPSLFHSRFGLYINYPVKEIYQKRYTTMWGVSRFVKQVFI